MKPQKTLSLFFFVFLSCYANGQLKTSRYFSTVGFPCSKRILLDSLGYFFKEEGCCGTSTISFGKYTISKGNLIAFKFLPFDSIPPISQIKYDIPNGDSLLTITLINKEGKPLGFNFNIRFRDSSGQVVGDNLFTDLEGQITIKRNQFSEILLDDLLPTFKVSPIKIDNRSIEIKFNLPSMFLWHNDVTAAKPELRRLLLTDKGLMTVNRKQIVYPVDK